MLASVLSVVGWPPLGAFSVVLETLVSGIYVLPFGSFSDLDATDSSSNCLVEGLVTGAILVFVYQARPELLESALNRKKMERSVPVRKFVVGALIATIGVAGVISLAASAHPDGLEWSIGRVTGSEELTASGPVYKDCEWISIENSSNAGLFNGSPSVRRLPSSAGLIGRTSASCLRSPREQRLSSQDQKRNKPKGNGRGINGPVRATRCNTARLRHFT
jgi:hypothetical protein